MNGEDELVARLVAQWSDVAWPVVVGPGDDCAVMADGDGWRLLKTDAMVEGAHFFPNENMQRVGWKAVARVQSDFAAMGGRAEALVVTVFIPDGYDVARLEQMYAGLARAAGEHGGVLCGGETCKLPAGAGLVVSVAGTGCCDGKPVLRSGARSGDLLCVTGVLGGSLAGHHLDFTPRVEQGVWLGKTGLARAMMDVSDGIAKDLRRMCARSGVGARIDVEALPCRDGCGVKQALTDGEDYELLFAVAVEDRDKLLEGWERNFSSVPVQVIGEFVEAGEGMSFDGGWDPFRVG